MWPDYDCLIVGGGLVGSAAALELHASGLRVGLIERHEAPNADPDTRALVLAPASRRILAARGVWARLEPLAVPIRHIHVSERGRYGTLHLDAAEAGLAALGWACPADRLLAELRRAAGTVLAEHWFAATRYLGHAATADHAVVTAAQAGRTLTLSTRLLIGADGAESTVRAAAGIGLTAEAYGQQAIVANLSVAAPQPDWAFERFTRRGPLAFIPQGGARYVAVQCLDDACAERALALDDEAYLALLSRRFGLRLGALSGLGSRRAHALVRRRAQALTGARCVLIGNAANTVHPNAAQGLNLGLRDVAGLALACADAPDAGAHEVLAAYAASRLRDQRQVGGFTDLLARAFRSPLLPVACARHAALAAIACLPPVRRALVLEASGLVALARMAHV